MDTYDSSNPINPARASTSSGKLNLVVWSTEEIHLGIPWSKYHFRKHRGDCLSPESSLGGVSWSSIAFSGLSLYSLAVSARGRFRLWNLPAQERTVDDSTIDV